MKPVIVSNDWPILRIVYDGDYSDAELAEFLQEMKAYSARQEPWVIFVDARKATRPSATQRKMIADNSVYDDRVQMTGLATLTDSALIRGALTALEWVTRPKYPSRVFTDADEAMKWLIRQLAAKGVKPPASLAGRYS